MSRSRALLTLLFAAGWLHGQTTPETPDAAAQRFVEQKPSAMRWLGLAEMKRAAGSRGEANLALARAVQSSAKPADAVAIHELLCWNLLPVGPANRLDFRRQLAKLKETGDGPWTFVFDLVLAASERDKEALAQAALKPDQQLPKSFPPVAAEKAHLDLLRELGWPRGKAGLAVLGARDYGPLHALRDLDRRLTREAEFLREDHGKSEAATVIKLRDRLRQTYLHAGRNLVERLFALNLLGETRERDALLARAKAVGYLNNPKMLQETLDRLREEQAWSLIERLLASEVAVIEAPPDLTPLQGTPVARMKVWARKKSGSAYEGAVTVKLGEPPVWFSCERLDVSMTKARTKLSGSETVLVHGIDAYPGGISAESFVYHCETGELVCSGDVRLAEANGTRTFRSCTLGRTGELLAQESLLTDFAKTKDIPARLELLKKIAKVYDDDELPGEVRYLLALSLLRPHLTWHAPYLPPPLDIREKVLRESKSAELSRDEVAKPWQEAMGGKSVGAEPWMWPDVPGKLLDKYRQDLATWNRANLDLGEKAKDRPKASAFFWRLRDPKHPELTRIVKLLESSANAHAWRWLAEIQRNNTVVTFDVPGGGSVGKDLPLVVDVRNGDKLSFKLYHVQRPEDLVWTCDRIGSDFIFRDHGLQHSDELKEVMKALAKRASERDQRKIVQPSLKMPEFKPQAMVHQWEVAVSELKTLQRWRWGRGHRWDDWDDRHSDDADASYFDDDCSRFRARLDKDYQPGETQPSSWQCDRIVQVPGKALAKAGAYILAAECNGQTVYVPVVIDPVSLTLRRCRDGVFVLASDSEGAKPLIGATVHGKGLLGQAVTDKEGAAFARMFAAGERAVVLHHEGRYAIGGFGRVFEGIYQSEWERDHWRWHRGGLRDISVAKQDQAEAAVYGDGHVVAAYTDRPSYRPGQNVHFKLIVRKLTAQPDAKPQAAGFRDEDFDLARNLALPDSKRPVDFAVLDPKGREVASGSLTVNDFGTAAGTIALNSETALGNYSLRLTVAGSSRLVPHVFAVKHYRLPNFEIDITGVPAKVKEPREIPVLVTGRYYFGKPLAGGKVEARLVHADRFASLATVEGVMKDDGTVELKLEPGRKLAAGKYHIICSVTDDSGRTVSKSVAIDIERDGQTIAEATTELAKLPRFVPMGKEFSVPTMAKYIIAIDALDKARRFAARNGIAMVNLPDCGWYRLTTSTAKRGQRKDGDDDADEVDLFAYGGNMEPREFEPRDRPRMRGRHREDEGPRWVNLSDFNQEESQSLSRYENPDQHLLALFDRRHVQVGDKLRILVYAPYKRARLLFTMEGRTVLDYFVTWTPQEPGCYHVIEIPVKERMLPNFYLQGRIIAGQERHNLEAAKKGAKEAELKELAREEDGLDLRWCRIDVLDPHRKLGSDKLKVQIDTDRTGYRPGDEVKVRLKVTDLDGKPRDAEVSLGAVDESVYTFGEDNVASLSSFFASPREERRFYPKAWRSSLGRKWDARVQEQAAKDLAMAMKALEDLSVKQGEAKQGEALESLAKGDSVSLRDRALPLPLLGGEMPIGQIPLARMRLDFRETATWQPQLRTGPDGLLATSFRLPDSLTKYRLTAVALTKQTELGVGLSHVQASMPLAVQVVLPRFAVEKDKLLAVGLVHNNTAKERTCQIRWDIHGARPGQPSPLPLEWRMETVGDKKIGRARIVIPAHGTAKVGLWLSLEEIGTATIALSATDAKDADAETRTLPVHPLGRHRDVAANGILKVPQADGKEPLKGFSHEARVQLPAGFHAEQLNLSMSCTDVAQSLDGLGYLVDYPYGCVEQTMSRFLPAVMVKHAIQRAPVTLPPDIALKLPDVLSKGLTRLYGFQHADGGWGWWEKDATNDGMSVYVVYGLARCRTTGTVVDAAVLQRGCDFLRQRLKDGNMSHALTARAWHALALAGQTDNKHLDKWARQALVQKHEPDDRCNLALACRAANLNELGERLWSSLKDWEPESTEKISLKLTAQIAHSSTWEDCRHSAQRLLARRNGGYWEHTKATSAAVESLAEMLRYVPQRAVVRRVQVWLNGKSVLHINDPAELKLLVYHLHLAAGQLPRGETIDLRLAADASEPVHFALSASGTQRMDKLPPTGDRIKVNRKLETLEGKPITGPVKVGQVFRVRLIVDLAQGEDFVHILDRRPAGCEFADERIDGVAARTAAHREFRDDRVGVFHTRLDAGRHELIYYLRAETPGTSHLLPGCAYPMYSDQIRGETGAHAIEVE